MSLKAQLEKARNDAMRSHDNLRRDVTRFILAQIKKIEVDERIELDDARVISVLTKLVTQNKDSLAQFETGKRQDLIEKTKAELAIISEFLPPAMSEQELSKLIQEAITAANATGPQDMGKVMNALKPKIQGRADMSLVSGKIKAMLAGK